jgi:catechol 2,3-dioxygenase-like lactoylglutathione lyase family enzyme
MGWRVLQVWPYGDLTLAYVLPPAQDDFRLEILGGPGATAPPRFGDVDASLGVNGYNHVCLSVDNVDETLAELRDRGVEIVNLPFEIDDIGPAWPSSATRGATCSRSPNASATTTPLTPNLLSTMAGPAPLTAEAGHGRPHTVPLDRPHWTSVPRSGRGLVIRVGVNGDAEEVEVPGIEPGSSVASSGLLRAQSAMPLLGSTGPADQPV